MLLITLHLAVARCQTAAALPYSCSFQIVGSNLIYGRNGTVSSVAIHCQGPDSIGMLVAPDLGPYVVNFTGVCQDDITYQLSMPT